MSYPPIKNDTRVEVTVRRSGKGDYTEAAIQTRAAHASETGTVFGHRDSHGLCYSVKFDNDGEAFFDPDELEVIDA